MSSRLTDLDFLRCLKVSKESDSEMEAKDKNSEDI
jgi:hypothetical protein